MQPQQGPNRATNWNKEGRLKTSTVDGKQNENHIMDIKGLHATTIERKRVKAKKCKDRPKDRQIKNCEV